MELMYKLDLVGVQEVGWNTGQSKRWGLYFFHGTENRQFGIAFLYPIV